MAFLHFPQIRIKHLRVLCSKLSGQSYTFNDYYFGRALRFLMFKYLYVRITGKTETSCVLYSSNHSKDLIVVKGQIKRTGGLKVQWHLDVSFPHENISTNNQFAQHIKPGKSFKNSSKTLPFRIKSFRKSQNLYWKLNHPIGAYDPMTPKVILNTLLLQGQTPLKYEYLTVWIVLQSKL